MVSKPNARPQHGTDYPDDLGLLDSSAGKPVAAGAIFVGVTVGLLICIPLWMLIAFAWRTLAQ